MQLYNTGSKALETLNPINQDKLTLYTCGPTVYSEPLIGNWVAYIRWDLLVRTLKNNGYKPYRVMNITDVGHLVSDGDEGEDKMEKGARREGVSAWDVAERYTHSFLKGMRELNLIAPEIIAKATDHIDDQIKLIEKLETGNHTYVIDDGVYFDTSTFPKYADFARLDLNEMKAGARVEYTSQKKNPSDFALWKFSKSGVKRDMEWNSPWGVGFPGWHIECSAMAIKYLGETVDIHTGGIDHIPVHHTNEIAQSQAATGKHFANIWMHANFLLVNGTKISKSFENGYTLKDIADKGYTPYDFKMFVMQSHYRSESNFSWDNLGAAASRLKQWRSVAALRHQIDSHGLDENLKKSISEQVMSANKALANDLSSPMALTHFENSLDLALNNTSAIDNKTLSMLIDSIDEAFGFKLMDETPDIDTNIKSLLKDREAARTANRWQKSDEIRDILATKRIGINDTPAGTQWYYL